MKGKGVHYLYLIRHGIYDRDTTPPDRDAYDVLVCHGNVIRWTLMRTVGADVKSWLNLDSGNGSLTIVAVRADGSTRLVMYSDVGHIPWEKQTWSGKGGGWVPASR